MARKAKGSRKQIKGQGPGKARTPTKKLGPSKPRKPAKPPKPPKPPKARQRRADKGRPLAAWILVSKVRHGRRYLYTYVHRRDDGMLLTIQVVSDTDARALRLAKRQYAVRDAAAFYGPYAYAYAYGGYAYAYGYGGEATAYRRGAYAYGYGYGVSGYGKGVTRGA
jgi:hypothetical protein